MNARAATIIAVVVTALGLASAACFLRFLAHRIRKTPSDLSDIFTGLSWVLLLALVVQQIVWTMIGGLGVHQALLTDDELRNYFVLFYINQITYFVLCPILKISIMLFYRKLFPTPHMVLLNRCMVCCLSAWGIANTLAAILQCTPVSKTWNRTAPGTCINLLGFLYGVQIPNIVFDFALLLIPVPFIWNIHRPTKDKVAITALFTLGGLGCISGLVRVVMLGQIDEDDIPYTSFEPAVWTSVEPSVAMICSCLPIIRGIMRRKSSGSPHRASSRWMGISGWSSTPRQGNGTATSAHVGLEGGPSPEYSLGPYKILVSHEIQVTSEARK